MHQNQNENKNKNKNQNENKTKTKAAIWRKDLGYYDGVVPLVEFDTYSFVFPAKILNALKHGEIKRVRDLSLLRQWFENKRPKVVQCQPDAATIYSHIRSGEWVLYGHFYQRQWLGYYMFRDTRVCMEELEGLPIVQCIASENWSNDSALFLAGFVETLFLNRKRFGVVQIDGLGDNLLLLNSTELPLLAKQPSAYYVYNVAVPSGPFAKEDCFICF
jgi:hypothetical protein